MADLNKESMAIWKSLKPMIDEEIKAQTRGSVQRRKMKVTTAPSLVTNVIGVTEPYGTEMLIPFNTNLSAAHIGDVVWVEFMYGATNAFASMYASADTKDWTVGGTLGVTGNTTLGGDLSVAGDESVTGDLTVSGDTTLNGVLDVTKRRCSASLSSAGWYRVMKLTYANSSYVRGAMGAEIVFHITRRRASAGEETHEIKMLCNFDNIAFVNESSLSQTQRIDKIRYTYTSAVAGYVDIHCSDACPNTTVDFEVYVDKNRRSFYTAESLQSVADAPTGETVLATYSFAEECTPEARVLLWDNWNTNDVNPQTISMDLSGYKFIEVIFDPFSSLGRIQCQRCLVGPSSSTPYSATLQYFYLRTDTTGTASVTAVSRDIDVYSSGVIIGNGQMLYNNTKYNDWPSRCRPLQIWGIR